MDWLKILEWDHTQVEDLRYIGYAYIKEGQYEVGKVIFEALTLIGKGQIYDLQTLGAIYLELNDNLKALNYLDQALKLDPNHLPTLLNKVKALFGLGYKKQANSLAQTLIDSANSEIAKKAEALIFLLG